MKAALPVKICGITRLEDAELAVSRGAWALGFVFHEKSPRYVEPETARAIAERFGGTSIQIVGVFVNTEAAQIARVARRVGLTAIQLNGDETPEYCVVLGRKLGLEFIKTIRPTDAAELKRLPAFVEAGPLLSAFLVAGPQLPDGAWEGAGRLANWALASEAKRYGRVILSGGLNPENVQDAIRVVEPFAVDVSSGVEDSPGVKSADKLKRFLEAVGKA